MRIARLDLTRYGRFNDYSIDFGPAPSDGPDFHVVYGLNEAGKSTAAAAILDLLFGIEKQSPYGAAETRASWHAYSAMRIGVRLEIGSRAHEIARLKRDKNSLVDGDNRPIDEAVLKAELAGVDRAAFRMMFSLDDESLENGGEAILASRGHLGELLFSASAGLAEFSSRLDALREKAAEFYRPRASKIELAELKHALKALNDAREKADTLASAYGEFVRQRDGARAAYDAAARALAERRSRADMVRRLVDALPHLAALRDAERNLEPLADLPTPPAGWTGEITGLQAEAIRLATRRETAEAAIRRLKGELEAIGDDTAALSIAARVEGWRELRSRYDAAKDIPARRAELDAKRAVIAEILRRLGREGDAEPQNLLLPVRAGGALEDLIAQRSGVEAKLNGAREAVDDARGALAQALDEAPNSADNSAFEALKSRLQAVRRDDPPSRLRAAHGEAEKRERKLADALMALKPWAGEPDALTRIAVPGEAETAALRQSLSQARERRQGHVDRLTARTAEAERMKAEALAAASASDFVSDENAAEIRAARDAAWSNHRAALAGTSADDFEAAMRRDDRAGAARLANARQLAAARERAVTLAGVEAERARARADLEEAERILNSLAHEIAALTPARLPAGRDPLSFLDAWRARRDEALTLAEGLRESKEAVRALGEDVERARKSLSHGLQGAGVAHEANASLDLLIEAAEAAVAATAKAEALRQKVKERRGDLRRTEARLEAAERDEARWQEAWRNACAGSWLAESDSLPAVGEMRQTMKALDELRATLKARADLEHRIGAMERDKRLFAEEVAKAGAALGLAADDDTGRLAEAAAARVAEAQENRRRREEKGGALVTAQEELAKVVEALAVNARLGAAMAEFFGVASLADVAGKLEDCKRRDSLRADIVRETQAILAANVASGIEAARACLEAADLGELEQELGELDTRAPRDAEEHAEFFAAYRDAERRLEAVGGDDAVAQIEEKRRTVLEMIKDGARRYLTLRAGVAAADEALRLYRDRHRGAMMERASKAFCEISRGAYRGLTTTPTGQSETLIALGADGGSKAAGQLSRGARCQLYLALRVAGYHEVAKSRPPAPFVADDIMETFDHFRAEEALRLFADMGRVGQVIYFTHHLHLAEIAKRVCPEARVHELAA